MRFSTTFKLSSAKSLIEKIKDAIHPKDAETLSVNVEMSFDISADELKELYREYRSEVDASNSDVSNFLGQIGKIWNAVKNFVHDILKEIVETEDDISRVQNAIHRLRKNAAENKSAFTIYAKKLAAEEKEAEKEINEEKTEE
jgi:predicted RNA-binding protein YlqC (UPF0109 family)